MTPKYVVLPKKVTPIRPASTMAAMSSPLLRCSSRRESSSIANMTPASGALKVAAIPAAPPATSRPCELTPRWRGSHPRACSMTPAAICTEGPSRPIASPASMLPAVNPILASETRSDTSRRRRRAPPVCSAAITCGMPDPAVPGA